MSASVFLRFGIPDLDALHFRLINIAPQIQEAIRTGVPTVKAVEEHARDLLPYPGGKQLFPDIYDSFAPAAADTAMFDPVRVKWLQTEQSSVEVGVAARKEAIAPWPWNRKDLPSGHLPLVQGLLEELQPGQSAVEL